MLEHTPETNPINSEKHNLLVSIVESNEFDAPLKPIFERLYQLPFKTGGSYSGHTDAHDIDRLKMNKPHPPSFSLTTGAQNTIEKSNISSALKYAHLNYR